MCVQCPQPSGSGGSHPWAAQDHLCILRCSGGRKRGQREIAAESARWECHPEVGHVSMPRPRGFGSLWGDKSLPHASVKVLREPSQSPRRMEATRSLHPKAHGQKGTEAPMSRPELSHQEPGPGSKRPSPARPRDWPRVRTPAPPLSTWTVWRGGPLFLVHTSMSTTCSTGAPPTWRGRWGGEGG